MEKPKRKNNEPSRWDRFLETVLLAKPFVWEVDLSLEECAEQLQKAAKPKNWIFTSRKLKVNAVQPQIYDFEIALISRSLTTAQAKGSIVIDNEKTIISGRVKLGTAVLGLPLFFAMIALICVPIMTYPRDFKLVLAGVEFCIFMVFLAYLAVGTSDHATLYDLLRDTFSPEDNPKIKRKNMMKPNKIRPLAICVFRRNGCILAAKGYDSHKQQTFYRPLGGGIEFGETSAETVVRELREEINAEVKDLRYLGRLEDIFKFNGKKGHEIVLIYDGALVDESLYMQASIEGREDGDDDPRFTAYWMALDDFRGKKAPPLYPNGLLELLDSEDNE